MSYSIYDSSVESTDCLYDHIREDIKYDFSLNVKKLLNVADVTKQVISQYIRNHERRFNIVIPEIIVTICILIYNKYYRT